MLRLARRFFIFLFSIAVLQGCLLLNGISVDNDVVYSTQKTKGLIKYTNAVERISPLQYVEQTVIKEIDDNADVTYTIYDLISLDRDSYPVDEKCFIIIEDEVIPIDVKLISSESVSTISDNRKDVITADSTKISVVTGYTENQKKEYRLTYDLNSDVVEKIKDSKLVLFRYYAGPDMITIKLKGFNLSKFKRVIDTK